MIDFNNTEIAFKNKSNQELQWAYRLFKIMRKSWMVKSGEVASNLAFKLHLPVTKLIKKTIFRQFCGGVSIADCTNQIEQLANCGIGTILDYSVEGKITEKDLDETCAEILRTIETAAHHKSIPFAVFKPSGLASIETLTLMSNSTIDISSTEKKACDAFIARVDSICKAAFASNLKLFIDAEDFQFQKAVDEVTEKMMEKYNQSTAVVYTTLQMYRHDRIAYLKNLYQSAIDKKYFVGIKLVRGAYMEKERERATAMKYASPIHPTKLKTDDDFNSAIDFITDRLDTFSICLATHNEHSTNRLISIMENKQISKTDERIYFAQLLGMSDHITFNLAHHKYNVAKYMPYGPVKEVMPYLLRRAQENSSVADQTSRELSLIIKEKKRRKNLVR